uniref:Uncharacterized protein n=1 Tax=Hippocampus comes TaxID=109280 RepID=A0A3Q2XR26_HIPCM
AVCSGLSWIHREIVCEEDYMEVSGRSGRSPGRPAQRRFCSDVADVGTAPGERAMASEDPRRQNVDSVELNPQVDGVDVVVLGVFLFYKRQLTVVTLDMSVACAVNAASYDGARLVWDLPRVLRPLLEEGAAFHSHRRSLEVDGVTLDERSAAAKGFGLVQQEELVQISVPFGAEGGDTRSLVVDNMYKESFAISLLYEHLFSAASPDGGGVDTKVRIVRVLPTPLLCRRPFSPDRNVVFQQYMGEGVVRYAIDVNFTLSHVPHRGSYYHHTSITAQVFSACKGASLSGVLFSVAMGPGARSLWEVGVERQPLTPQLAAQRGYKLLNDSQKITLEVPVFSVGYTYEDINLSNFYATFKLLLRDARTLEVQTSTSKNCLFKTEDMIVCSSDGIITVVTRPASTWPTVRPERTSLLDPACRPKETDAARVLFQFKLDSCGTRAAVGDYMLYENEILHDRQLIADGPNFISRDSQFKLTVRCFYPLSGINRLTADRISRSETPGFGSIDVFGSLTGQSCVSARACAYVSQYEAQFNECAEYFPVDPKNLSPDCSQQLSRNEMSPSESAQTQGTGQVAPMPGPSRSLSIPGRPSETDLNSPKRQSVPQHAQTPPGPSTLPAQGRLEDPFPHEYDPSADSRLQPSRQTWHVKRVEAPGPIRNWSPVGQTELSKPNEPQRTSEEEPRQGSGPFHTETKQHKRPGGTPPIYPSKSIPVAQIPPGFGQSPKQLGLRNQSVDRVQSIRVKPQRQLAFHIPGHGGIHWPSPGLTAVGNAKHQTPRRPEAPKRFAPAGNWQRLAESPNARGKMSSALDGVQMAGMDSNEQCDKIDVEKVTSA